MQVVYLNEARVSIFSASIDQQMILRPGRNQVDDVLFREVKAKSDEFNRQCDLGVIVVQGEVVDIAKLATGKALGLVDLETTIVGVQELLDQELAAKKPRKTVTDAATAKIEAIKLAEQEPAVKASIEARSNDGGAN